MEPTRPTLSCRCQLVPSCCTLVRVPLTHRDLKRLATSTGHPSSHFVEWLAPDEVDMSGEPETFVEVDLGRRLMVLRHERGACLSLTNEGWCGTYEARPAPCAAYPYAFDEPRPLTSGVRRLFVLGDAPCAHAMPGRDDESARAAVQCVEVELNEYVRLVSEWNRQQLRRRFAGHRPRSAAEFLAYLSP
ncbi:MAG: YkgJ family cysteine cluster protein [Myxococcales bacterium]